MIKTSSCLHFFRTIFFWNSCCYLSSYQFLKKIRFWCDLEILYQIFCWITQISIYKVNTSQKIIWIKFLKFLFRPMSIIKSKHLNLLSKIPFFNEILLRKSDPQRNQFTFSMITWWNYPILIIKNYCNAFIISKSIKHFIYQS